MSKIKWQLASKKNAGVHIYTAMESVSLWRIQSVLLQTHRALFLTASSILLSASAVLFSLKGTSDFGIISLPHFNLFNVMSMALAVLGIVVVGLWKKVTGKRTQLMYFFQYLSLKVERGAQITGVMETFMKFEVAAPEQQVEFLAPFLKVKYKNSAKKNVDISKILSGIPAFIHWVFASLIVLNLLEMIFGQG